MDFLDSLGISTPSDDAVAARIHQQAAADSDYHQDKWLDSIPRKRGAGAVTKNSRTTALYTR